MEAYPTYSVMIGIIEDAAEKMGGLTKLAAALGVRHNTFYSWKRVPAERVLEIERLTGISRHAIRPDVFGEAEASARLVSERA